VVALSDPSRLKGDAALARDQWLAAGGEIDQWPAADAPAAEIIVDAMLRTGLDRPVGGSYREAVELVNESGCPVLAVDIPSGLSADTGSVMGAAVHARATVSFIGLKRGLVTGSATEYVGELVFDDLDVPPAIFEEIPSDCDLLDPRTLADAIAPRSRNAHKGMFGSVLVVGGDHGMLGAALLASRAALRAGAGLVKVASHSDHAARVPLAQAELMSAAVEDAPALIRAIDWADILAAGPGMGQGAWCDTVMPAVLACGKPLVLDADGLNWLAENPQPRNDWVLTPHPGEAARLLETSVGQIQADRFAAARQIAERFQAVCVLKGAGTVIADADTASVCVLGNPGMATAGMGDVLTGAIVAMMAQGLAPLQAARVGVTAHALAGDLAAEAGQRGLCAGDVIDKLRGAVNP
jgi:NAD(P)H-hydrate epimerase